MAAELVDDVRRYLAAGELPATAVHVADAILACGEIPGDAAVGRLVSELQSELVGAGPLEPLLRDPNTSDVLVNGNRAVWVDRGTGLEESSVTFRDEQSVRRLAQRLASLAGRRLDDASPYVDARLPDGARLHAIVPPLSSVGTCISIRVPRKRDFTLKELVQAEAMPVAAIPWLQAIVTSKCAYLISGGTGTGKTTLLSALLATVPRNERVLVVEDSGELNPDHDHVVRLEARSANVEGQGKIELRDLLRQALRMRPDRIVVGEVRGAEVVDLLAALNTGHEGGCGTVHANSAEDVPARLEALALAAGLGREALHAQVGAGIDAVIHLNRSRSGLRRISGINVLRAPPKPGSAHWINESVPAVIFMSDRVVAGPGYEQLARRLGFGSHPNGVLDASAPGGVGAVGEVRVAAVRQAGGEGELAASAGQADTEGELVGDAVFGEKSTGVSKSSSDL